MKTIEKNVSNSRHKLYIMKSVNKEEKTNKQ